MAKKTDPVLIVRIHGEKDRDISVSVRKGLQEKNRRQARDMLGKAVNEQKRADHHRDAAIRITFLVSKAESNRTQVKQEDIMGDGLGTLWELIESELEKLRTVTPSRAPV